eukprot:m.231834 g.231834  ORF g.231834 m.231834 type:complete len:85 (-) comp15227_c1_seq1:374-628(-)
MRLSSLYLLRLFVIAELLKHCHALRRTVASLRQQLGRNCFVNSGTLESTVSGAHSNHSGALNCYIPLLADRGCANKRTTKHITS